MELFDTIAPKFEFFTIIRVTEELKIDWVGLPVELYAVYKQKAPYSPVVPNRYLLRYRLW